MRYKVVLGLVWLVTVGLLAMTPVSSLGAEWVDYELQGMRMSVPPTWVSTGDEETFIEALDEAGEEYPELKTLSNGVTSLMNESVDTLFLSDTLSQTNLNLGVASNPDGLPSDAELEMIAAVAPKKLEDMGKEFGIEMQVLDARILMLPTGKAIQTYSEVIFNSELTPATISQYQYIFVTEELFYYLNLSTPQVLFEGMAPIFERIAHTIRIDDYPDSWTEHTDETGQISLRLPSVWGQNATTAAQPALKFSPPDSPLTVIVEVESLKAITSLPKLEAYLTASLEEAQHELISLKKFYLPSGSYLRAHILLESGIEQHLFVTSHNANLITFRFSMKADKFGIMTAIFEQIMDTVRLQSPES